MSGRPNDKWMATMIAKHGSREAVRKNQEEQGRKGGQNGTTGGFASDVVGKDGLTGRQRASVAGTKGGMKSKRPPTKNSKIGTKEITPPVWVEQPNQSLTSSESTTNGIYPCVSCGENYNASELDEARLCPNCPVEHEVAKKHWYDRFFGVERPF